MSKSASLPKQRFDTEATESSTAAWKQEVNERLAAHRTRRGDATGATDNRAAESPRTASSRAAEAAARVAARYAKAPSYSQLLAGEARAVVRAAGAAAEAALAAEAAAQAVLAGLESGMQAGHQDRAFWEPEVPAAPVVHAAPVSPAVSRWQDEPPVVTPEPVDVSRQWAGAQARWEEALPVTAPPPAAGRDVWSDMRVHPNPAPEREYRHDADENDLFSHDPVGHATVEPVQHLPANLIEFPRELTATRKARPRLAEGPLYDAAAEDSAQLSIFEVDPELLAPPIAMMATEVAPPEWASIELNHVPAYSYAEIEAVEHHAYADTSHLESQYAYAHEAAVQAQRATAAPEVTAPKYAAPLAETASVVSRAEDHVVRESIRPQMAAANEAPAELLVARVSDRMLAAVVDGALVMLAFLAAAVVVIASTEHPPTGKIALIASGFGLALFYLLYQYLFLSYAEEGTPGMRYARIALCTFCDENPTRQQMQMRIPAMVLATVPAGLGLVWALFDGEKLGWHDRLTKTYQRKY